MSEVNIQITQLEHGQDLPLPQYATGGSSGLDLVAAIEDDVVIAPGERAIVPAGIAIALPEGYEAQIRPRSGLSAKQGITVLNTPGTIDADYRGEIKAILVNLGQDSFTVTRGLRMAQMVIAPVTRANLTLVDHPLGETERGEGRFGSTGLYAAGAAK